MKYYDKVDATQFNGNVNEFVSELQSKYPKEKYNIWNNLSRIKKLMERLAGRPPIHIHLGGWEVRWSDGRVKWFEDDEFKARFTDRQTENMNVCETKEVKDE